MNKKHQTLIITGSLVTTLFLSNASFTLSKALDFRHHEQSQPLYVPKTFAEHVEEQLVTGDLSPEREVVYQRILQKVQAATSNS